MFTICKTQILTGDFKLPEMLQKIEALWIEGSIDDEERSKLITLAYKYTNVNNGVDLLEMVQMIAEDVKELNERLSKLEGKPQTPGDDQSKTTPVDWKQPIGSLGAYKEGDLVIHNGHVYKNMLKDVQNVWEPGTDGVDARFWDDLGTLEQWKAEHQKPEQQPDTPEQKPDTPEQKPDTQEPSHPDKPTTDQGDQKDSDDGKESAEAPTTSNEPKHMDTGSSSDSSSTSVLE